MAVSIRRRPRVQRRLQLRLDADLVDRLDGCADRSGVSISALVQIVLEDVIAEGGLPLSEVLNRKARGSELPALAALWATEEMRRAMAVVNPYLRRDEQQHRAEALLDAEARLEDLRRHLDGAG